MTPSGRITGAWYTKRWTYHSSGEAMTGRMPKPSATARIAPAGPSTDRTISTTNAAAATTPSDAPPTRPSGTGPTRRGVGSPCQRSLSTTYDITRPLTVEPVAVRVSPGADGTTVDLRNGGRPQPLRLAATAGVMMVPLARSRLSRRASPS
jgi:hypothetical protein